MSGNRHVRTLEPPKDVNRWSLTTLREKLVKIGATVVRHGRYVTFHRAGPVYSFILQPPEKFSL